MGRPARAIQTPGVDQPEAIDPDENPADELARLRAENEALKVQTGDHEKTRATRAILDDKLTSNKPQAGLRASDVNPAKIRRAVLTEDGWVCPAVAAMPSGVV